MLERVQRDPWELEAVRRLDALKYAGIEYYRAENPESLEVWEAEFACELSLAVEKMVRWWESMPKHSVGRPKRDNLDRAEMREARRVRYNRIWSNFHFAQGHGGVVVGASSRHALLRHFDRTRAAVRFLEPLEAFDQADAGSGVWWLV